MNDRIESDHMPVELYCKCQVNSDTANVEEEAVKRDKYIWHVDRIDQFQEILLSQVYRERMVEAQNLIEDCPAKSLEIFTEALLQAASGLKTKGTNTGKKRYDNKVEVALLSELEFKHQVTTARGEGGRRGRGA